MLLHHLQWLSYLFSFNYHSFVCVIVRLKQTCFVLYCTIDICTPICSAGQWLQLYRHLMLVMRTSLVSQLCIPVTSGDSTALNERIRPELMTKSILAMDAALDLSTICSLIVVMLSVCLCMCLSVCYYSTTRAVYSKVATMVPIQSTQSIAQIELRDCAKMCIQKLQQYIAYHGTFILLSWCF